MISRSSPYCYRPAWLVLNVSTLLSFIICGLAWGRIGETREEMIQRLGEPKKKGETFCRFSLNDITLSARFKNGICVEEDYDITRVKAEKRERIRRIESLLSDASGGKSWDIVNLAGGEVEWETKDGTLNAVLHNEEETGGTRDDPDSWVAEYLTVTSTAFQAAERERIKKQVKANERDYPFPLLRIAILVILGIWAALLWQDKRRKLSVLLWVFILAANPLVPLHKVPILFGGILIVGYAAFWFLAAMASLLAKHRFGPPKDT